MWTRIIRLWLWRFQILWHWMVCFFWPKDKCWHFVLRMNRCVVYAPENDGEGRAPWGVYSNVQEAYAHWKNHEKKGMCIFWRGDYWGDVHVQTAPRGWGTSLAWFLRTMMDQWRHCDDQRWIWISRGMQSVVCVQVPKMPAYFVGHAIGHYSLTLLRALKNSLKTREKITLFLVAISLQGQVVMGFWHHRILRFVRAIDVALCAGVVDWQNIEDNIAYVKRKFLEPLSSLEVICVYEGGEQLDMPLNNAQYFASHSFANINEKLSFDDWVVKAQRPIVFQNSSCIPQEKERVLPGSPESKLNLSLPLSFAYRPGAVALDGLGSSGLFSDMVRSVNDGQACLHNHTAPSFLREQGGVERGTVRHTRMRDMLGISMGKPMNKQPKQVNMTAKNPECSLSMMFVILCFSLLSLGLVTYAVHVMHHFRVQRKILKNLSIERLDWVKQLQAVPLQAKQIGKVHHLLDQAYHQKQNLSHFLGLVKHVMGDNYFLISLSLTPSRARFVLNTRQQCEAWENFLDVWRDTLVHYPLLSRPNFLAYPVILDTASPLGDSQKAHKS